MHRRSWVLSERARRDVSGSEPFHAIIEAVDPIAHRRTLGERDVRYDALKIDKIDRSAGDDGTDI